LYVVLYESETWSLTLKEGKEKDPSKRKDAEKSIRIEGEGKKTGR
jgi:hypothetical protein